MTETISYLLKHDMLEQLVHDYSPNEVAMTLTFKDSIRLSYRLLYNKIWNEELQEYSVNLLLVIRNLYSKEWNASWEYEAFLGMACNITLKYDERYEAYKKAFEKTNNPPPELLIEFARCCICPGSPPISYEYAINLVLRALEKGPFADGIGLLSHIYSLKNDSKQEKYWNELLQKSDKTYVSPPIEPPFLKDEH